MNKAIFSIFLLLFLTSSVFSQTVVAPRKRELREKHIEQQADKQKTSIKYIDFVIDGEPTPGHWLIYKEITGDKTKDICSLSCFLPDRSMILVHASKIDNQTTVQTSYFIKQETLYVAFKKVDRSSNVVSFKETVLKKDPTEEDKSAISKLNAIAKQILSTCPFEEVANTKKSESKFTINAIGEYNFYPSNEDVPLKNIPIETEHQRQFGENIELEEPDPLEDERYRYTDKDGLIFFSDRPIPQPNNCENNWEVEKNLTDIELKKGPYTQYYCSCVRPDGTTVIINMKQYETKIVTIRVVYKLTQRFYFWCDLSLDDTLQPTSELSWSAHKNGSLAANADSIRAWMDEVQNIQADTLFKKTKDMLNKCPLKDITKHKETLTYLY